MNISYNWLKEFVKTDWSENQISELLTDLGLEVEGIQHYESVQGSLSGIVVGKVLTCKQHPNADRLKCTTVDVGEDEPLSIVCGAPNVAKGQTVVVAKVGSTLYPTDGNSFQIKKSKIRGEESQGMICAEDEIGIGKSHEGIIVLSNAIQAGTPCREIFELVNDKVFEIGLTPNRADAMSHYGVARDLRAGLLQKKNQCELISPSVSDFHVETRNNQIRVDVVNKEAAPRYCGVRISGVKIEASPDHIKNRLLAIGLQPINNIVDITNYVLHELGQPLHAFDAAKIDANLVKVQNCKEGTLFTTLDGIERKLHADDLMICNGNIPMCIAGVFGGLDSGVSEDTTEIFLESAYFDPVSIRKTAKRHGLNTEASFRYERGINIEFTDYALKRASLLIKEIAGGEISSDLIDEYPTKKEPKQILISYKYINNLIGVVLPPETIKRILISLDIQINNVTETAIGLTVPSYRVDVTRPADIVEEILRVYGYNNIPIADTLKISLPHQKDLDFNKWESKVASYLIANGFFELYNNSLTTPSHHQNKADFVKILNPLSTELSVLRSHLVYGALESMAHNINRKQHDCRFFEFGHSYFRTDMEYHQKKWLCLSLTGTQQPNHWLGNRYENDFFMLKGFLESLFLNLGINVITLPFSDPRYKEGLKLEVNSKNIGHFGLINLNVFENISINQEVIVAELDWSSIVKMAENVSLSSKKISKFPSVKRDLALLLDDHISFEDLHTLAFQTERKILQSVQLFDVFTGNGIAKGKKSYALSFSLQDATKTLTDKQIDKIISKIQNQFELKLGAEVRSS